MICSCESQPGKLQSLVTNRVEVTKDVGTVFPANMHISLNDVKRESDAKLTLCCVNVLLKGSFVWQDK